MPKLSLVIPCKWPQDQRLLDALLTSIKVQTFAPYTEVHIVTEGNSEEAKAIGIQACRGDVIGMLCADNFLLGFTFLEDMYREAQAPGVVGAYTRHYAYMSEDPALNRYFALLGANDPLCWWLGKADRDSYLRAAGKNRAGESNVRTFDRYIPSLGDNGCFFKRAALQEVGIADDPATFGSCMDMCVRLQARSYLAPLEAYRTYTITPNVLWHQTGLSFWGYLRRRYEYVGQLYFARRRTRSWHMVAGPTDWLRTGAFALASLLVVPQLLVSLCGYQRVRDPAWFLHPLVCLCLTVAYAVAWLEHLMHRLWSARRVLTPMTRLWPVLGGKP